VPNTEAGTATKAQALAVLGVLNLGLFSGTLFLYWQGGDAFASWLLSYRPASDSPATNAVKSMLDLASEALQAAGIPFKIE
jgi:hypothetical protein